MFAVIGLSSFKSALILGAFAVVLMALMAAADTVIRLAWAGRLTEIDSLQRNSIIAIPGALTATAITLYSQMALSANVRWVEEFDFLQLGCVLWLPIVHVGILRWSGRVS
jgi:hypothetical protein